MLVIVPPAAPSCMLHMTVVSVVPVTVVVNVWTPPGSNMTDGGSMVTEIGTALTVVVCDA